MSEKPVEFYVVMDPDNKPRGIGRTLTQAWTMAGVADRSFKLMVKSREFHGWRCERYEAVRVPLQHPVPAPLGPKIIGPLGPTLVSIPPLAA